MVLKPGHEEGLIMSTHRGNEMAILKNLILALWHWKFQMYKRVNCFKLIGILMWNDFVLRSKRNNSFFRLKKYIKKEVMVSNIQFPYNENNKCKEKLPNTHWESNLFLGMMKCS